MDPNRCTKPAARKAAGAPSCPSDIAAALVGAPSRAILFAWRTTLTATQELLGICLSRQSRLVRHRVLPRRKLRRQSKTYVFANQIEIAMIRETEIRQTLANLLHQNFRSRGAGRQPEGLYAFEPRRVDVIGVFDQTRCHTRTLCHFHQAVGIRTIR